MANRANLTAALGYVRAYVEGAKRDAEANGRIPTTIDDNLIEYQAERALELTEKFSRRGAVVLDDPVGTGKTVVALVTAMLLLDSDKVDRVVIIAPNEGVRRLWLERASFLGLDERSKVEFKTRTLPRAPRTLPTRKRTLMIVDEAHRGLQKEDGATYEVLAKHAADARVLLVTATPFQLEARGLVSMLRLPEASATAPVAKKVKGEPIKRYATAVAKLLIAEHDDDPDTTEAKSKIEVASLEVDAQTAMEPFFISRFDRSRVGLEEFAKRGIPAIGDCPTPPEWARLYHVLRVLPELPRLHHTLEAVGSSDSYQRMLLSSHRAVLHHKAFLDVSEWAEGAEAPEEASELIAQMTELLADPDETTHPKVAATTRWVAERMTDQLQPSHVLVFCVYTQTRHALVEAITRAVPRLRVESPENAAQARALRDTGFGQPVDGDNGAMAMIVQDRLSESVDLDGGSPCVVHHDLVWNPVRWDQRMGRVIRASSGFTPVAEQDIYLPVLDVAADKRLYDTMSKRRELSGAVLQMAALVGDRGDVE